MYGSGFVHVKDAPPDLLLQLPAPVVLHVEPVQQGGRVGKPRYLDIVNTPNYVSRFCRYPPYPELGVPLEHGAPVAVPAPVPVPAHPRPLRLLEPRHASLAADEKNICIITKIDA